jgi:diguanylate cyclase (GGDEF)-like protein/PAS domain S-box-containing protein
MVTASAMPASTLREPLAATGLASCAAGLAAAGVVRWRKDRSATARAWLVMTAAGALIDVLLALVVLATGEADPATWPTAGQFVVVAIAPLGLAAALAFPGPGRGTRAERRLLLMDLAVAAVACGVIVLFMRPAGPLEWVAAGLTWLFMCAVVLVAARARRAGGLPLQQLLPLLVAAGILVLSELMAIGDSPAGPVLLSMVAAATGLCGWAALRDPYEGETPGESRVRQHIGVTAPLVPVAVALAMVAWGAASALGWPGPARAAVTVVLTAFVITVTIWRVWAATGWRAQLGAQGVLGIQGAADQAWFQALAAEAQDLISVTDPNGVVVFQTPSVGRTLGFEPRYFTGRRWSDMVVAYQQADAVSLFGKALDGPGTAVQGGLTLMTRGGGSRATQTTITALATDDELTSVVISSRDVTDQSAGVDRQVDAADLDPLTGLMNRAALRRELERSTTVMAKGRLAVLSLDIDGFRGINDAVGNASGDYVLAQVAKALRRCVRPWDLVGRLGGDEFAVIVLGSNAERSVARIHERLTAQLAAVVTDDGREISLTFSSGYSVSETGQETPDELLRNAGLAMDRARTSNSVAMLRFDAKMHEALMARVNAEQELRQALSRRELAVRYQPIVDLAGGGIVGVEALVRWDHPRRGQISAVDFVPMAEDLGLADELGGWVLRRACADLAQLRRKGAWPEGARMNVNISAGQLGPRLIEQVASAVRISGARFEDLTLEITESVLADRLAQATEVLSDIRRLGCLVALDDFGTGYSSLGYLAQLPVDVLKIDRSFVGGARTSPHFLTLTRMIIGLAEALGLACVAEGVETGEQRRTLLALGCARAQGYLFHEPLSLEDLQRELTGARSVVAVSPRAATIEP